MTELVMYLQVIFKSGVHMLGLYFSWLDFDAKNKFYIVIILVELKMRHQQKLTLLSHKQSTQSRSNIIR